ncbi:cupin domain-containing protein [Psychrosphaera sp. F3M07]|mgnify:CR=1 FL=1|uniref:cupin domain-containing protein n=1 Tax=Psychrosphaera sp. F3M07 TaxID=2841560 RepID=UPI001C094C1A|nr:cupin domain-containing protein [Psychrosphaera sp. F3M07]MBU2919589.1 cupin domain-containing protein [Psychrosphaera sp. F3M07]
MAREHVEFIQSQVLDWQSWPHLKGIEYKELSTDKETGATTGLFKFPEGWKEKQAYWMESEEEFFVVEGDIEINDVHYSEGCFGYLPARYLRRTVRANKDTTIIRFLDQNPAPTYYNYGDPLPEVGKAPVESLNTYEMVWDKGVLDPKLLHLDFGRKILRIDPETKSKTFLYMVSPQVRPESWSGPREHHPTVEESFTLYGTLAGDRGVMRTGSYFWRPPGIPHGPYGSRTGCVLLIRFVGGAHVNHWSEKMYPFSFDAPYRPILPKHLRGKGLKEWKPTPF